MRFILWQKEEICGARGKERGALVLSSGNGSRHGLICSSKCVRLMRWLWSELAGEIWSSSVQPQEAQYLPSIYYLPPLHAVKT